MTSPARTEAVVVSRELPAPPDRVFDWLTKPDRLARWMAPQGQVIAQADARQGGRLLIVMFDGDTRIEHRGEFLEVSRPKRLAFTWNSPYTDGDSLVTVDLVPQGELTRLTLRHERLPAKIVEAHAGGWAAILDRLVSELAAESSQPAC